MTKRYQVAGIGNAIVDVLTNCDDAFLSEMDIQKGIMQLIEGDRAETLYAAMTERAQASGGSVANALAGLGALGLETAFVGRVRDDALGRFYAEDMGRVGTDFVNPPAPAGELPTSRSMIFVSPDGERSMNTYLGISAELGPDDLDERVVADAGILLLEGYLFDKDKGKSAFRAAARASRAAGGIAGISLSDPFCVERHRADFRRLVADEMNFVIGNEEEWVGLYQTDSVGPALEQAGAECELVVCTQSGAPVVVIDRGRRIELAVDRVAPVDATGAGDQFAAGFLSGLAEGRDLEICGRRGILAAGEVIGHMGARPEADIRALFRAEGLG